ncbi:hypothetical protein X766_33750 [Mesorhizobium sp. LSJC255A00]|nr:hypothetical protein X766_33750 [Mesorhizobium sp. LSJC255A00]
MLDNKLDEVPFKVLAIQLDNELHESSIYMPFYPLNQALRS